ncbi:MAG TPA: hypothetical protein H9786_11465 [Candidatus Brachybacterium merdavium]|uniref:ATP synthase protein I n=1 Tax=Candidatus Brachybacterium merdavium TaxID=2838513 RepID=A0A9D2LEG9_9MICO|nr:hypothetical protein [Candidatus Brachybacterium merdavium]
MQGSSQDPAAGTPSRPVVTRADRAMQRATMLSLLIGVGLDVIVIIVAAVAFESPAVWGALVGTALTLVVVLPTVASAYFAPRRSPLSMAVMVLASWAGKMIIVIVVLLLVRDSEQVSIAWVGLALLVGALSAIAIEMTMLLRVRQPLNVATPPSTDDGPRSS